jgi:hypothetical protein
VTVRRRDKDYCDPKISSIDLISSQNSRLYTRPSPVGIVCAGYSSATVNGWRTCEFRPDMPDGEEISSQTRNNVKWRFTNATEDEAASKLSADGAGTHGVLLKSVTIEVVNVIPVSS